MRVQSILATAVGLAALLFTAAPAQAQNRFYLVNRSALPIEQAFVSPSRQSVWGPDILGSQVLPPRNQVWVTPNFPDCVLDIRVRFADGSDATRMRVNACGVTQVVFAGSAPQTTRHPPARRGNPSFTLYNGSGMTIREVYSSLSTENTWGSDRLGSRSLPPGGRMFVTLPLNGGCHTDIRIVYSSGQDSERRGVETCSLRQVNWRQ